MSTNRSQEPPIVIGTSTTYEGTEHSYLRGYLMQILAVLRPTTPNPDGIQILKTDAGIADAGGVGIGDRVEVRPWLEEEGRWSLVTSDPRAEDLARFAYLRN